MPIWSGRLGRDMYREGAATRVVPEGPAVAGLEDAFRPHFFAGVATVVTKLLIQCEPDVALFGEKDYQQLKVVTRLARDLGLKTRIVGMPTVREKDGLAMSSRNAYFVARTARRSAGALSGAQGMRQADRVGRALAVVLHDGRKAIAERRLRARLFGSAQRRTWRR